MEGPRLLKKGIILIATGGYAGYVPLAPGTAGSLIGILIYWASDLTPLASSIFILLLFIVGIFVSDKAEKIFERKDPPQIVVDELLGAFISVFLIPKSIGYIIGGFLLFRFFDIVKPYPIRKLEGIKGGLGVMLDDVLAAIYTNIILQILMIFL